MTNDRYGREIPPKRYLELSSVVWIISKYDDECAECEAQINAGDHVLFSPQRDDKRRLYCRDCGEEIKPYPSERYWENRQGEQL